MLKRQEITIHEQSNHIEDSDHNKDISYCYVKCNIW